MKLYVVKILVFHATQSRYTPDGVSQIGVNKSREHAQMSIYTNCMGNNSCTDIRNFVQQN